MVASLKLTLLALLAPTAIAGSTGRNVCKLRSPVQELEFDPYTQTFSAVYDDEGNPRYLQDSDLPSSPKRSRWLENIPFPFLRTGTPESHQIPRDLMEVPQEDGKIRLLARYCDCTVSEEQEPIFCPATVDYCGSNSPDEQLSCFSSSSKRDFASNALFIASAWLCTILFWLYCSVPGKYVRDYLIGFVVPYWDVDTAIAMQRHMPERALYLMRSNLRRTHRNDQEWVYDANAVRRLMMEMNGTPVSDKPNDGRRPVALRLHTCVYIPEDHSQALEEDDIDDCAICYQDLEPGDRVGKLACGHKFHAACLKEWCVRRNACPLCNQVDIAEPEFDNDVEAVANDMRRNLRI